MLDQFVIDQFVIEQRNHDKSFGNILFVQSIKWMFYTHLYFYVLFLYVLFRVMLKPDTIRVEVQWGREKSLKWYVLTVPNL